MKANTASTTDNSKVTAQLRAGAGCVDITPPLGTHLSGSEMGNRRPAREVLDPLQAKAIVFEADGKRACIVTLDITIITGEYTERIRQGISARLGIPPEAIMVHAIQTHSAPSLGYFMLDQDFPLVTTPETEYLRGAEHVYGDFAAGAAIQAAEQAASRLQPVRLGLGRGSLGNLAFNRRGVRRDGTVMMPPPLAVVNQPLGLTDLAYLEGPSDPEVGVACFQDMDGKPLAFLLHYTCHPVNAFGYPETYHSVSADWCGAWSSEMQAAFGKDVVPLVINGCCGNINPWDPFDAERKPDHRRMGRALGGMAQRVMGSLTFSESSDLAWRLRSIPLAYRDVPPERLAEVEQILSSQPEMPRGANGEVEPRWFAAASTRSVELCRKREPQFMYEVQALRIGDLALVGLPGEPFVEGQLAIKVGSAAKHTFVAHLTTKYVGYLPTREAYARGGHEANFQVTYWAKLAPGSLETATATAKEMIKELF
jgi:neutral ceramidase